MKLNLPISGQSISLTDRSLIVNSHDELRVLSSATLNGGLGIANSILVQQVQSGFRCSSPQKYLVRTAEKHNLDPNVTIGFLTAADIRKFGISNLRLGRIRVSAVATAGTSNSARSGEPIKSSRNGVGTINILVLTDVRATDACLVNAVQTATEAKTLAFRELDIRSSNSREEATCTSTDAVMIGTTNQGLVCEHAGVATAFGRSIARAVNQAVKNAIIKHDRLFPSRHLLDRLQERGITYKDLENAFLKKYVHHKTFGSRGRSRKIFRHLLEEASSDYNVAALVLAALRIEDDGRLGLIPGLKNRDFTKDPVSLLADEIIGIAISNYVAGSKGLFEYARFDKEKPGIIGRLGPFADDAIGALVAGASSNVYSKLLGKRQN